MTDTKNLHLLSICLAFYFGMGMYHKTFSLICVGLFYGVLNKRYRFYLMLIVFITALMGSMRSGYRLPVTIRSMIEVYNLSENFNLWDYFNYTFPEYQFDYVLPIWLKILVNLSLLPIAIIMIIAVLPMILYQVFHMIITYIYFETIGRFVYGLDFWKLISLVKQTENPTQIIELIMPCLPSLYVFQVIIYALVFPIVFYKVLKIIGFYKRIPAIIS